MKAATTHAKFSLFGEMRCVLKFACGVCFQSWVFLGNECDYQAFCLLGCERQQICAQCVRLSQTIDFWVLHSYSWSDRMATKEMIRQQVRETPKSSLSSLSQHTTEEKTKINFKTRRNESTKTIKHQIWVRFTAQRIPGSLSARSWRILRKVRLCAFTCLIPFPYPS